VHVTDRIRLLIGGTWLGRDRIVGIPNPLLAAALLGAIAASVALLAAGPDTIADGDPDMPQGVAASLLAAGVLVLAGGGLLLGRAELDRDGFTLQQPLWGGKPRVRVSWERIEAIEVRRAYRGIGLLQIAAARGPRTNRQVLGFHGAGLAGPLLTAAVAVERGIVPDHVEVRIDDRPLLIRRGSRRNRVRLGRALTRRDAGSATPPS
jgi:hypothetical protein